MREEVALSLSGVKKKAGAFTFGPIDLEIEKGYCVAVVGPNGSGKSTLFRLVQNLTRPDAGSINVLGLQQPEQEVKIKQSIGYMPDAVFGFEEMTAVQAGNFSQQWYPSWNEDRFEELIRKMEIDRYQAIEKMSKGTQQRVLFALAVARDPQLLLLDEPTANLDPFVSRVMMEEIARELEDGEKTVVIATHSMEEVRKFADYVLFLHRGKLLGYYEKDEVLDSWKELWVEGTVAEIARTPGVVSAEGKGPVRVVTCSLEETEQSLRERGHTVLRVHSLELDEIFAELLKEHDRGGNHHVASSVETGRS